MNKQSAAASSGINAETLTMIRTRFILDWYTNYATKFPFKLFELQRQLLQLRGRAECEACRFWRRL